MKTLMIGLMAWGIAGATQAQDGGDWLSVGGTDDLMMAIDTSRIRTVNGKQRVWGVIAYNPPHPEVSYLMGLQEYDCENETVALLQANHYDADGVSVFDESRGSMTYIIPGTMDDAVRAYVCDQEIDEVVRFATVGAFVQWTQGLQLGE